jgi:hypothetical protein
LGGGTVGEPKMSAADDIEHGVYVCTWSRSPDGFALWLRASADIRGDGRTYAQAEERLIEAIQNAGGAMQTVLEFDPPLPKSKVEAKYSSPELYLIGGDDRFETDAPKGHAFETPAERAIRLKWVDTFFQSPVCRKCAFAVGQRSEKSLTLEYAPRVHDGAFGHVGHEGTTTLQIVSEEFLRLLTAEELANLTLRPVFRKGRGRKFFEVTGPAGPPFVAAAGLEFAGWRCGACDHRTWGYWLEDMAIGAFVAKSDLPASPPDVFTVGIPPEIHLCATAQRWHELVGRKGTRGFVSTLLGVVPEHEVVRHPELATRNGSFWEITNRIS